MHVLLCQHVERQEDALVRKACKLHCCFFLVTLISHREISISTTHELSLASVILNGRRRGNEAFWVVCMLRKLIITQDNVEADRGVILFPFESAKKNLKFTRRPRVIRAAILGGTSNKCREFARPVVHGVAEQLHARTRIRRAYTHASVRSRAREPLLVRFEMEIGGDLGILN